MDYLLALAPENADDDNKLILFANAGDLDGVTRLLAANANVNATEFDGETALLLAAKNGHTSIVTTLLQANADVNITSLFGKSALVMSAKNGHTDIVGILLHANARIHRRNGFRSSQDALLYSAENGHIEIVNMLLKASADVNSMDEKGSTPLIMSARNGHFGIVSVLLAANAEVNSHLKQTGETALHISSEKGYTAIVKALLQAQADINSLDHNACTPLMGAAMWGRRHTAKVLIHACADLNIVNRWKLTALGQCNYNLIDILLRFNASVDILPQRKVITAITCCLESLKREVLAVNTYLNDRFYFVPPELLDIIILYAYSPESRAAPLY